VGKVRRGGFIFISWIGDHAPRHVHVYRDATLVLKWDIENGEAMKGKPTKRILQLIQELEEAGLL
jgi:hypothetical protein